MFKLLEMSFGEDKYYGIEILVFVKRGVRRSLIHIIYDSDDFYLYIGFLFRCFGFNMSE